MTLVLGGGSNPSAGWSALAPSAHERTLMLAKCGRKCFLGPHKSFPICAKGTCKRNKKGIFAAYIRAREHGSKKMRTKRTRRTRRTKRSQTTSKKTYQKIAKRAKKMF
jgi:hypothetical protein